MLAATKLLHKITGKSTKTDQIVHALKEELERERARADDLLHEMLQLKSQFSDELCSLKSKLAAEKQMSSVLRRSFTMRTVEECWDRKLPELSEVGQRLQHEIMQLERKTLDLEAENYAVEERSKSLACENDALRDSLVRPT
jgi:hypothetical protein